VDVFSLVSRKYKPPEFSETNVRTHYIDAEKGFPGFTRKQPVLGTTTLLLYLVFFILRATRNRYDFVIGIERKGLWLAVLISKIRRSRAIYFSLELLFFSEILGLRRKIDKMLERVANKYCKLSIVQDKSRSQLLARENGISPKTIVELPNSSLGKAFHKKTHFLYNKLRILKDKFLILSMGTLDYWSYSRELALESRNIGSSNILVLHSRSKVGHSRERQDNFVRNLIALQRENENLRLSLQAVNYDELEKLVRSADVGIALYKLSNTPYLQKNIEKIGLSSGKIAQYLKCGIPVITNDVTSLVSIIEDFDCGIVIQQVSQLREAIARIKENYSYYSKNACQCFNSVFNFEKKFQGFMAKLSRL
jgi:glycosyltransferase involved in cell wall biosynthesis